MILHVLRALFILLMGAVGYFLLLQPQQVFGAYTWLTLGIVLSIGVLIVCVDILSPRRKLAVFSGTFLGLLVGVFIAYALSFVVTLVVDYVIAVVNGHDPTKPVVITDRSRGDIIQFINMMVGITVCYLTISFVLQTKD